MTSRPGVVVAILCLLLPVEGAAQWSSDLPGVPRAAISKFGAVQGRFELDGSWQKLGDGMADTTVTSLRMGAGWSWRIASNWELGFDLTLAEARRLTLPETQNGAGASVEADDVFSGTAGYGLRVGLKFRPVSYVDPEGNGVEAAIGVGYQPRIEPLFAFEKQGDSTVTSGVVGSDSTNVGEIHSSFLFMVAMGYRSPRVTADLAFVAENADQSFASPLEVYSGITPKLGIRYRLTHGFSVGASFWGSGAPPWRDRVKGVGESSDANLGFLLSFGGAPEKGVDLMVSSPTGAFGESVSVYLSAR